MIRFAILGPGNISRRFIGGFRHTTGAVLTAFASRTPKQARDYARENGVEKVYSYEELYLDPEIDAVYVSTPQYVHFQQVKECLRHHKHVIVEKPMCITADEAEELFQIAKDNGVILMEAHKGLHLPIARQMKAWVDSGLIGDIQAAEASFCRTASGPPEKLWGGNIPGLGAVYDVGCYALAELLYLCPGKLKEFTRIDDVHNGCPLNSTIVMKNENNVIMTAVTSLSYTKDNWVIIHGSKGMIKAQDYWKGHKATLITEDHEEVFMSDFDSEFTFQIQHLIDLIKENRTESPVVTPELSIHIMKILEKQ